MAVGRIILPALAFVPLDGTADNLAPTLDLVQGSGSPPANTPTPRFPRWTFNHADFRWLCVAFRLPDDYVSDPAFKIDWYCDTYEADRYVGWTTYIAAITGNDATIVEEELADSYNMTACEVLAAGRLAQDQNTIGNADGLAAGDLVMLIFGRRGSEGAGDSYTGDAFFLGGVLEYKAG